MSEKELSMLRRIQRNLKSQLLRGVLVVVPVGMTFFVLKFIFVSIDGFFAPLARKMVGRSIPGLGLLLTVVFLYLAGLFASNFFGRKIIAWGEAIFSKTPLVRKVYQASKQVIDTILRPGGMGFKQVVLIEYPRQGLKSVGFVTGYFQDGGQRKINVFVPTTPNPTSGMVVIADEADVYVTDLSIEAGLKWVVSGGILAPDVSGQSKNLEAETTTSHE